MKCAGCETINNHEALFCVVCGKPLEDWNPQSVLRQAAIAARPRGATAAERPQKRGKPEKGSSPTKAAPPKQVTPSVNFAAAPSGKPAASASSGKPAALAPSGSPAKPAPAPSGAPARAAAAGSPARPDAPRQFAPDPWDVPSSSATPSKSGGFYVPGGASPDSAAAASSDAPTATPKQLLDMALAYRGMVRTYLALAAVWVVRGIVWSTHAPNRSSPLDGLLNVAFALLLIATIYFVWQVCGVLGCGGTAAFLLVTLFVPFATFMAFVVLVGSAWSWLAVRGVKVGALGPDDHTIARLRSNTR